MPSKDTIYSLNQQREQCHTQTMPRVGEGELRRKERGKNGNTEGIKKELIIFEEKPSERVRGVWMDQYWRKQQIHDKAGA